MLAIFKQKIDALGTPCFLILWKVTGRRQVTAETRTDDDNPSSEKFIETINLRLTPVSNVRIHAVSVTCPADFSIHHGRSPRLRCWGTLAPSS